MCALLPNVGATSQTLSAPAPAPRSPGPTRAPAPTEPESRGRSHRPRSSAIARSGRSAWGALPRAHRILQGATVHDDHQQQPQGIHDDVALPALHLLASVEPTGPPFSVVWTDWLSITAALGVASRPSDCLTRSRKAS